MDKLNTNKNDNVIEAGDQSLPPSSTKIINSDIELAARLYEEYKPPTSAHYSLLANKIIYCNSEITIENGYLVYCLMNNKHKIKCESMYALLTHMMYVFGAFNGFWGYTIMQNASENNVLLPYVPRYGMLSMMCVGNSPLTIIMQNGVVVISHMSEKAVFSNNVYGESIWMRIEEHILKWLVNFDTWLACVTRYLSLRKAESGSIGLTYINPYGSLPVKADIMFDTLRSYITSTQSRTTIDVKRIVANTPKMPNRTTPMQIKKISPIAEKISPIAEKIAPIAEKIAPIAEKISPIAEKISRINSNFKSLSDEPDYQTTRVVIVGKCALCRAEIAKHAKYALTECGCYRFCHECKSKNAIMAMTKCPTCRKDAHLKVVNADLN